MKNGIIFGIIATIGLLFGPVFAQDDYDYDSGTDYGTTSSSDSETSTTTTYTPATPAPATPSYSSTSYTTTTSGPGTKAPRTGIYNSVMQQNLAADFTTADYLVRPHLIEDQQYVAGYTSPSTGTMIDAAFALSAMGMNWLGGMENYSRTGGTISRLRIGVGTALFGAGIMYELNQVGTETPTTTTKTTQIGDAYGIFGSMTLGGPSLIASVTRETSPGVKTLTETTGAPDAEQKSVTTGVTLGFVKDSDGEGSHALGAVVDVDLWKTEAEALGATTVDESGTDIIFGLLHGLPMKKSEDMSVFIGGTALVGYSKETDDQAAVAGDQKDQGTFFFTLAPNLEAQKQIGKGFEFLFGTSINLFTWASTKTTDLGAATPPAAGLVDVETTASVLNTAYNGTGSAAGEVALGLRWVKGDFAIEGQLSKALLRNGPNFIGGTAPGVFTSVGVTAGF